MPALFSITIIVTMVMSIGLNTMVFSLRLRACAPMKITNVRARSV